MHEHPYCSNPGSCCLLVASCSACLCFDQCQAQERPYFVTYSQDMEEPGNLEIETFNVVGNPKGGDRLHGIGRRI